MVTEDGFDLPPHSLPDAQLCTLLSQDATPPRARIAELLRQGASPNAHASWRDTSALCIAANSGHVAAMKQLLEAGANILDTNYRGNNCLHEAAFRHRPKAVSFILSLPQAKQLLNQQNHEGETPLAITFDSRPPEYSASHITRITQTCSKLLEAAPDTTLADKRGWTALMRCAMNDLPDCLSQLIRHSPDINQQDTSKQSALYHAVRECKIRNAEALLRAGANPTLAATQEALLACAAIHNPHGFDDKTLPLRMDMLLLLSDWGVPIDDLIGPRTLLGIEIHDGCHPSLVQTLLDLGARIPSFAPNRPCPPLEERRKVATARWEAFMASTPPDLASLTSQDLIYFANIRRLDDAMQPALWSGHEAHLRELLAALPPVLAQRILASQPAFANALSQPELQQLQYAEWHGNIGPQKGSPEKPSIR